MSDVVIRAEGLGKKYLIGHQPKPDRQSTLRDAVCDASSALRRSLRDMVRGNQLVAGDEVEEFWALKDVNFEIRRGQVVGIIGRNGAGKSTLLKILSRVTEPSKGRVSIHGRVASLLEVGTGFHPELTGRENIYLNGAILGMSHNEIRRKFDEIVEFSGVEKFLDTPVKRYSSGMYVRLAFAVAAHLEPEILVVDEVLAVGDAEFQKKCLGKMHDVAGSGRTILFVSHNMAAVERLCDRALQMRAGKIETNGHVADVISAYLIDNQQEASCEFAPPKSARIVRACLKDKAGQVVHHVLMGEPFQLEVELSEADELTGGRLLGFSIYDQTGARVAGFNTGMRTATNEISGRVVTFLVESFPVTPGTYSINLSLTAGNTEFIERYESCLSLNVEARDIYGNGFLYGREQGMIYLDARWKS